MQTSRTEIRGRSCQLRVPVRDRNGHTRFDERPTVLHEIWNLGRHMYLARFADGTTMYLFQHEIKFDDE